MGRIERIQVTPSRLEFARPYTTARGTIAHRDRVEIEIGLAGSETGRGETVAMTLRGGIDSEAIARELTGPVTKALVEAPEGEVGALGDPAIDAVAAVATLVGRCASAGAGSEARAAVDLALFDLCGKLRAAPVWRLLGAEAADGVACNATLTAGAADDIAADARSWLADGYTTFKLKVGLERDLETLAAVREVAGESARIRIDANGTWDVETAAARLTAMAETGPLELVEQPCASTAEMTRLRELTQVPIAADESVTDPESARAAVAHGAVDMATVKIAKVGGICAALEIAGELPIYVSSALDGPTGIAAGAHLAVALSARGADAGVAHGLATQRLFAEWPTDAAVLDGSVLRVPDGPGLGVA